MAGASQGINKQVKIKKESGGWGVKSSASGSRLYRRVTASFQLEKDVYNSNEIRTSQQMSDMRHGTRRSTGSLSGELSGSSYDELIAAALRKDFIAGATTGAIITLSSTLTTFARSAGSFIADGFHAGKVILSSGFTDAGNNGLFLVTGVTATVLTRTPLQGQTPTVEAAGDTVTILEKGKYTYTPLTGHTDDSFTVEEWYPDSVISRTFLGEQVDTMSLSLQPNSMATIDFGFLGKDAEPATGAEYFTSPTAIGGEGVYSSPDGFLFINGVANGLVTSLNINVANGITQEAVIGSNSIGAKSRGKVAVTIDSSAIFDNDDILNYFDAESEISLTYVLMTSDNQDCFVAHMPRVKVGSGTTDDGEKVVILSFSGTALENSQPATGTLQSTLILQDSTL